MGVGARATWILARRPAGFFTITCSNERIEGGSEDGGATIQLLFNEQSESDSEDRGVALSGESLSRGFGFRGLGFRDLRRSVWALSGDCRPGPPLV